MAQRLHTHTQIPLLLLLLPVELSGLCRSSNIRATVSLLISTGVRLSELVQPVCLMVWRSIRALAQRSSRESESKNATRNDVCLHRASARYLLAELGEHGSERSERGKRRRCSLSLSGALCECTKCCKCYTERERICATYD